MNLLYGEIEILLAHLHCIAREHRVALKGRIKHLQRSGWPGGTNTGPGHPAGYGLSETLKLCLGFELLQMGLPPEKAVDLLRTHWDATIWPALKAAAGASGPAHAEYPDESVYLCFDPGALGRLSGDGRIDIAFICARSGQPWETVAGQRRSGPRRLAVLNVTSLLREIEEYMMNSAILPGRDLRETWTEWMRLVRGGRERSDEEATLYNKQKSEEMEQFRKSLYAGLPSRSQ